ncbi:MAG: hypothetical protein WC838_04935 [Candidatus Margulisiibacteriota bacterium]|jgi:hypothetical protein
MNILDIVKLVFMALYCTGVTIASFWYFFAITFTKIPEDNVQNSNLILGFLIGSAISTFLGYYFGTSQSTNKGGPPFTPVDQAAIDAAKVQAVKVIEPPVIVPDPTKKEGE